MSETNTPRTPLSAYRRWASLVRGLTLIGGAAVVLDAAGCFGGIGLWPWPRGPGVNWWLVGAAAFCGAVGVLSCWMAATGRRLVG
jgi:hypothetical protein